MDWFERLTGFRETDYSETRAKLRIDGQHLVSLINGKRYSIGRFELISLRDLRDRASAARIPPGHLQSSSVSGDIRDFHRIPEYAGALFQVASQANCLEMIGPDVTPEDGVTRYEHDFTQGPACAIAAGAATILRNYFVPIGSEAGQTRARQLNLFEDLSQALSRALQQPIEALWTNRNGYLLASRPGLEMVGAHLARLSEAGFDHLRGLIRIGLHWDAQVTDATHTPPPFVSQAFCSALPVAYMDHPTELWAPLARLVLEASYESTLLAGALNHKRGRSALVFLTHLGGGAFGNRREWIDDALHRAVALASGYELNLRIVSRR